MKKSEVENLKEQIVQTAREWVELADLAAALATRIRRVVIVPEGGRYEHMIARVIEVRCEAELISQHEALRAQLATKELCMARLVGELVGAGMP